MYKQNPKKPKSKENKDLEKKRTTSKGCVTTIKGITYA